MSSPERKERGGALCWQNTLQTQFCLTLPTILESGYCYTHFTNGTEHQRGYVTFPRSQPGITNPDPHPPLCHCPPFTGNKVYFMHPRQQMSKHRNFSV